MEHIIKAKNIVKYYGQMKVLDINEFKLHTGSFNFLLGPNGSGKTTLLNILSLVDNEFEGQLFYKERAIDKSDSLLLRKKFSVIWQDPYLFKGSVYTNIALPLKLRNVSGNEIRERINQLSRELEIAHLLNKKSNQLSGGEKQKVSIARALITKPELLFIDEPTTNLDTESNRFYNDMFAELVNDNVTIFLITHDLEQVERLTGFASILRKGQIIDRGPVEDVINEENLSYERLKIIR